MELNTRYQAFANLMIIGNHTATQAYMEIWGAKNAKSCSVSANRLMKNAKISKMVKEGRAKASSLATEKAIESAATQEAIPLLTFSTKVAIVSKIANDETLTIGERLKAIQIHNDMVGDKAVEQRNITGEITTKTEAMPDDKFKKVISAINKLAKHNG